MRAPTPTEPADTSGLADQDLLDLPLDGEETPSPSSRRLVAPPGGSPSPPSPVARPAGGPRAATAAADDDTAELPVTAVAMARRRAVWPWLVLAFALAPLAAVAAWYLKPSPAVMALETALLDFHQARLGERAAVQAIAVHNRGQRPLTITAATVTGEAAADFGLAADDCRARPVPAAGSCTVRVLFQPSAEGARTAAVRLVAAAANSPLAVPLRGVGIAPRLRVEPAELVFGGRPLGTTGTPQQVTVHNDGSAPLAVAELVLEGLAAADFVAHGDRCGGRTLAPGAQCGLELYFVPTAEGPRQAIAWVRSDAPGAMPSVVLRGDGLAREPLLSLARTSIDFGVQVLGELSPAETLEVHNDGSAPLTLTAVALAAGADPGFAVDAAACTAVALVPGASCAIDVRFRPPRQGPAQAVLQIGHSAGAAADEVPLRAIGIAPGVRVEPFRLGVGEVALGARSGGSTLALTNSGLAPLTVRDVRLYGGDARFFSVRSDGCSGQTLAPEARCRVAVALRPERAGPHQTELVIRHNAAGGAERVPITGFGLVARLHADLARLAFGAVAAGGQRDLRLELSNRGRAALRLAAIQLTGPDRRQFRVEESSCGGRTLGPGQRCALVVRFAPRAEGGSRATLVVEHDGDGGRLEVPLTGSATPPPAG